MEINMKKHTKTMFLLIVKRFFDHELQHAERAYSL